MQWKSPGWTVRKQKKEQRKEETEIRRLEGACTRVRPRSQQDQVEAGDNTDILENRRAFREESQGHTGSTAFFFF